MSEQKGKNNRPEYSVDEILAEYGSGKSAPKVVEFPEPDPSDDAFDAPEKPAPPKEHPSAHEAEPIPEIVPESLGRRLNARLHTLLRRADHYADHMYDQAEPDETIRKAEKYIPGVDHEDVSEEDEEPPRKPRRFLWPEQVPPDTPPAQLAARAQKGLKAQKRRLRLAILLSILSVMGSIDLSFFSWDALMEQIGIKGMSAFQLRSLAITGLLALVGLLCLEVLAKGAYRLVTLRPCAESLTFLAWCFTLADGLTIGRLEGREGCLPCGAVTALGIAFALWGEHAHRRGDRMSAKAAAQVHEPYVVTLDESKWNGRPAYTKESGLAVGVGSQLQMEDAVQRAYRIAAPLLVLGCTLCAAMASVGQEAPERFLWSASACFTAASSWSALLAYALPYRKLAERLYKEGASLAGWPGVSRCRSGGVIIGDQDLFPAGSVSVTQVHAYNNIPTETVVGCAATMMRAMDCGLTRPFHDLLRSQGASYGEVTDLRWEEGGASGYIGRHEVVVGTAAFMHLMDIPLPPGHNIKNAIFCSVDGRLAGIFPLNYALSTAVNPSLSALMRAGISPVLATRDPNLIPALLEQKFKLPVERLDFPPVERRFELSRRDQEHDETPVALLSREGLAAYSDAIVGGSRLRSAARWGLCFTLIGAAAGLFLTFYLTSIAAYASLTAVNFLVFMAAWLVPELLIANWVNQY